MLKTNFTCSYCQQTHHTDYLASINKLNLDKSLLQKEVWEKELVRLKTEQITNNNPALTNQINNCLQQLHYLDLQLQTGQEYVCQSCHQKFLVKKEISKFVCEVCNLDTEAKLCEGHIANYQFQGISPRKWSKFCQSCQDTKVIMANPYCPRQGDGRDDDWDITKPQYDCDCPATDDLHDIH